MDYDPRKELQRILNQLGLEHAVEALTERLSLSDLSTLLLEVFRETTGHSSAADLLKRYASNRFVAPSALHPIALKKLEIQLLEIAETHSFAPVQLSPVAPLGSCSIVASADQNKIISALRGTEVVADATNALALQLCHGIKTGAMSNEPEPLRFSTTHRHVRAQQFSKPGLLPHFHLFCMVSSGKDKGSYSFEKQTLAEHLRVYQTIFKTIYDTELTVSLNRRGGYKDSAGLVERTADFIANAVPGLSVIENKTETDNLYYQGLQFTLIVTLNGQTLQIGDGGLVDWPQQLLGNKKERMMISAIGIERLLML
ncbi:hypothetical protein [Paenibacillus cremeus]|uniref:Uncharacterized protein n=1 Tax=Paenibacillus cremeus TaxID=2163881 RepID=A0A559K631_9BACL|nr:hypothetical protein [Paenibacillus cremeus]TVY07601.1 hypothetical protein FPZ49_22925 [Paenibacillus cremeus]